MYDTQGTLVGGPEGWGRRARGAHATGSNDIDRSSHDDALLCHVANYCRYGG